MKCDICNRDFSNSDGNIIIQKNKHDGKYYCMECAIGGNREKANAVLADVRADIQKLEFFQSVHALEENAYIKAIQDAIDIIDKKVSEHFS